MINSMRTVCRHISFQNLPEKVACHLSKREIPVLRGYATAPKRFYKKTGILYCDGLYEITLDHRKLKTPKGRVMKLDNEILALMVATEWDAQKEEIQPSSMHLNALCNTSLENPNKVVKGDEIDKLVGFLETDTILYHSQSEDIYSLQKKEWDPVINWFSNKYDIEIAATTDLGGPSVPDETKHIIRRYLSSYNMSSIHGFSLVVESLKSIILTLSCVERRLNVEQAVLLSRLEEEFQAGRWGRVEWAHDINQLDLQSRVAAGIIFIQLNSMTEETKAKLALKFR